MENSKSNSYNHELGDLQFYFNSLSIFQLSAMVLMFIKQLRASLNIV